MTRRGAVPSLWVCSVALVLGCLAPASPALADDASPAFIVALPPGT